MSREVKFRAWVKPGGLSNHVNGVIAEAKPDFLGKDCLIKRVDLVGKENFVEIFDFDRIILMQYIGRKDGNDDYIFEEDIASVIIQFYVFGFYQETEYVGIVKYDEKECVYYLDLLNKPLESGETIPDEIDGIPISSESDEEINRFYFNENIDEADIRILGNIYENPELLEANNE